MIRRSLILYFLLSLAAIPLGASGTGLPESADPDAVNAAPESEAETIIPPSGLSVSTQPITPVAVLPKKNLYDQGLEELALAQELRKKDRVEAASDAALQAYDDLTAVHAARRDKKRRKKLRADRHLAATVYIDASTAYIEEFVKKGGRSPQAIEEGRARLGDLRDVSMSYPELNKKVSQALEQYSVTPSSPVATPN